MGSFLNRLACLAACACVVAPLAAETVQMPVPVADGPRPRVGLVLAGGGAKGGAHVGVLKVLEQLHVPIDCIAGTSMGALVGGGYASGIPADELEHFVTNIDWKKVVGRQGRRDLEPIEQKRASVTYSNDFEFGVTPDGLTMPGGIVNTSNVEDLLRSYVASARLESDFSALPIPYRAVATDMVTGTMVVLGEGDLATAMRASMAIPGAFAPVEIEEKILSDGGLVRNIPIDVARELCADVVIVVNLVEPAVDPRRLRSAVQMLGRTMDVMIEANETLQLRTLRPGDVRIDVEMGTITTADFERVPETIPLGEAAALAVRDRLARLAVPEARYREWRSAVTTSQRIEARLAGVRFEGLERVNPAFLEQRGKFAPGDLVDSNALSAQAQRLSALQDFDSVGYRLEGDPASPTLTWLPREKSWGPNYLRADLGVYTSSEGDLTFVLYGRHVRTWLNPRGGEWRNELQFGGETRLATGVYQPLDVAQRWFIEPALRFQRTYEDFYLDQERVARYRFRDAVAQLDFGLNMGRYAQARVGYLYDDRKVDVDIGAQILPEIDPVDAGMLVSLEYDSRDQTFAPTRGLALAFEYLNSDEALGADRNWGRAELGMRVALPFRRNVWWITAAGGSSINGDLPGDRVFALGGPGSFQGFEVGEVRAGGYWTLGTSYLWNVKDLMPIRNLAWYAGVRVIGGAVYDRIEDGEGESIYGGAVFLTGRTIAGPLTVGVGTTSTDSWSVWLGVGRPVGHGTILERGIFR